VGLGTPPTPLGASTWRFPPSDDWPDDELVARGGDLSPSAIVEAYRRGLFPMPYSDDQTVDMAWWSPTRRAIIPLDGLRMSRSLRRSMRRYRTSIDERFPEVIRACAEVPRPAGWISEAIIDAFCELHRLGWAHSVESCDESGRHVGGLYGVRVGGLFVGESMFHLARDASKVALVALVEAMRDEEMVLLDAQWMTGHLASLGAVEVSRASYLRMLAEAIAS